MAAGAKGQPGIEDDGQTSIIGQSMPARCDQQALSDRNRLELRLGQANPVLVGNRSDLAHSGRGHAERPGRSIEQSHRIGLLVEHGGQDGSSPAWQARGRCGRHAGLAIQRLLVRRLGIGILGLHRQRAGLQQCVAPGFGIVWPDFDQQFLPSRHESRPVSRDVARACSRGNGSRSRRPRSSNRRAGRDAAADWSGCLRPPFPTAQCASA